MFQSGAKMKVKYSSADNGSGPWYLVGTNKIYHNIKFGEIHERI
jgi:hypothetical protein